MLLRDEAPTINGDGEHSRDFTYIDNVIEANLRACLAPKEACGRAYNIAYGGRVSLNELYGTLKELTFDQIASREFKIQNIDFGMEYRAETGISLLKEISDYEHVFLLFTDTATKKIEYFLRKEKS